ncbi:Clr5 domain-containing protein [Neurospora intermedia]|uniref:Clr5 domain-containing protein n=1 Tax=Neurospora intermedia TaxID=5142 RepID=A0ABR3DB60_NEUIN
MTKQWEDHRHIIIREYKDNNKPLHEVKKFMEERYRFRASIRAYRSRFDRWRVRKYTSRKRRDSFAAKSDKSVLSESSDDGIGSPPPSSSPIHRRGSGSRQEHPSIHYIGSGMYESTTPTEVSLSPSGHPNFEPLRQLYPTDPLAGLLPGSGLHSSKRGLVNNFRYPPDHQGYYDTGIYRQVHDPVFHTKFTEGCSQLLLHHCFADRALATRFPRPIQ